MQAREKFLTVLLTLAKVADERSLRYCYGGGHIHAQRFSDGVDCSGLVRLPLVWTGFRMENWECTSRTLFREFGARPDISPADLIAGMLAFWRDAEGIVKHVEVCVRSVITQPPLCIGARQSLNKTAHWADAFKPRGTLIWAGAADPFD
jgi:hypothetical protein